MKCSTIAIALGCILLSAEGNALISACDFSSGIHRAYPSYQVQALKWISYITLFAFPVIVDVEVINRRSALARARQLLLGLELG